MTWVFGSAIKMFGTSIIVGDIQVTLEDGETVDCLRKVYPLEQNFAAGFAGNVQVGFSMLAALQSVVREVAAESRKLADPAVSLDRFSQFAAAAWQDLGSEHQEGGSELLVAAASEAHQTLYNSRSHLVKLRAPHFEVEPIERNKWGSIGSGSDVAGYRAELEALSSEDGEQPLQAETMGPGGMGWAMFITLLSNVFEMPDEEGISKHFHHVTVLASGCKEGTSNREFFPVDGPPQKIELPHVATSWSELQAILKKRIGTAPAWARG